jgi:hypothetical protein
VYYAYAVTILFSLELLCRVVTSFHLPGMSCSLLRLGWRTLGWRTHKGGRRTFAQQAGMGSPVELLCRVVTSFHLPGMSCSLLRLGWRTLGWYSGRLCPFLSVFYVLVRSREEGVWYALSLSLRKKKTAALYARYWLYWSIGDRSIR